MATKSSPVATNSTNTSARSTMKPARQWAQMSVPDGIHGVGVKVINGVEVDLSTVEVVGEFTGSQMAAVDVDAPVGLDRPR